MASTAHTALTPKVSFEKNTVSSSLISKNITIRGHRTSVRLEPEMWDALYDIALRESTTIHNICSLISLRKMDETSLTAAIRVFLMLYLFRMKSCLNELKMIQWGHGIII